MNNELMIFEGEQLEILTKEDVSIKFDGEILMRGKQAASILLYSNTAKAISDHVEDDYFPKIIPKGFKVELNSPMCIRKYYKERLNDYQLHKEICKTMIELMKWAEKLPEWEENYEEDIE